MTAASKARFRALGQAAIGRISDTSEDVAIYHRRRRIAFYDTEVDGRITSLPEFTQAELSLSGEQIFCDHFGESESRRVTLQFVYELLNRIDQPVFEESSFEDYCSSFWAEVENPDWTYFAVANLQNFDADFSSADLGDGISIRGRKFEELRTLLGWDEFELEAMQRDWMESGGASSYIMLVEERIPKTPETVLLANAPKLLTKAHRILLAMQLLKPGDIRIGRMWDARPAAFNVSGGLSSSLGAHGWNPGKQYLLKESEIDSIRELYLLLERLRTRLEDRLPGIALALRTFSSVYDRSFRQGTDRVIDEITALEALLPTNAELAFKLAYRVAGLLATDDAMRVSYFNKMKAYYRTRSKIVHGSRLNARDRELIRDDEPLRSIVRRLLVGFLHLAESTQIKLGGKFYEEQLDGDLLHGRKRNNLRRAMKLV